MMSAIDQSKEVKASDSDIVSTVITEGLLGKCKMSSIRAVI